MRKNLILFIVGIMSLTAFGRDFVYDGISYTVIDENDKTCETKAGLYFSHPGNIVSGNITIPQEVYDGKSYYTVIRVGKCSFSSNKHLKTVKLPNSVVSIGSSAFDFSGIKNVSLPESIQQIESSAFEWCIKLETIKLPEGLDSISPRAFMWCESLKSINIPSSVQSIGDWAFDGCENLASVSLPDSLLKIGRWAFSNCDKLTKMTIPERVASIERGAFSRCAKLESIYVSPANTDYKSRDGVLFNFDLTTLIQYPAGKKGGYDIPQSVITLNSESFSDCKYLKTVVIPHNVSQIGDECFMGSVLETITIPDSIDEIPWQAFYYCKNLSSVKLPETIKSIGLWAFGNCKNLHSINIPKSCNVIEPRAFAYCKSLKSIYLSNSLVVSVGEKVFIGCSKLSDIIIDAPIISLGNLAFDKCNNIKTIELLSDEAHLYTNTDIFTDKTLHNAQLYVNPNILEYVKTTHPWSLFKNIHLLH